MTSGPSQRLDPSPTQLIDRSRTVVFEFDGKAVEAYEGDTIASALAAAGTSTFSRSFKYHRPRGLLCVAGRCPNCLVNVDGVPNVRCCTEPARQGIEVSHQNAWPSLDRDVLSVLDRLDRLMPVGFYYKALHRPKILWRLAQRVIRRVAGIGVLRVDDVPDRRYHHRNLSADVAVIGGGPAGLSAALAAAESAARVILVDDQPNLGGHLRFESRVHSDLPDLDDGAGFEIAKRLAEAVEAAPNIQALSGATAFAFYQDNLIGLLSDSHLTKLRARSVVIATGAQEVPMTFERNDLPGVMLSSGALRLVHLYGVRPGAIALVATSNDSGYSAALDLLHAGVEIAAVVDSRGPAGDGLEAAESLRSRGVLVLSSHAVVRAEGKERVTAAVVRRLQDGSPTAEGRRIECDTICLSGVPEPAGSLVYQAGGRFVQDGLLGQVPEGLPTGVLVAGEVTGVHDLAVSVLQGRLGGARAAGSDVSLAELEQALSTALAGDRSKTDVWLPALLPVEGPKKPKSFVCVCEDITAGDIADAIDEGFDDIQTLKRYSTVTMGPCQGKMCMGAFVAICAQRTGRTVDQTGVTTLRPPLQPVPLGALAGPSHIPIMRTPMDRKHREMGASMVDLGTWQRAYSYGSPQEECRAVRERVGIIDVSTLGKLDVAGRDAPALLDRVYTHRFSDLRVGRIRYGILCGDNGTIMDDGTVTRLTEDRYLVTTTTGNMELIEEWFKWWMAGTGMCVHVTNVTSDLAAINVAGPWARDTIGKLTELDLTKRDFRYMRSARGTVAGVPTMMLRIGFVGETGWELHFPAEYGEQMWDALLDAGEEFGIAPFGLEAQRILRLEKKHIIVGQDTDLVSNPLESDMEWVVKFDKEDFIGRGGLVGVSERGFRNRLVGFVMKDSQVPEDGDPVVLGDAPIGRVTSARLSPTLGKGFGMAWVPVDLAEEGAEILIRIGNRSLSAEVSLQPVYDPEGVRLRE